MAAMTLQDQIATVEEAIAVGALEVDIMQNGVRKRTRFESFDALRRRLEWLKDQLAEQQGLPPRRANVGFAQFKR